MPTLIANNLGVISVEKNVEHQVAVAPERVTIPVITLNQPIEPLKLDDGDDDLDQTPWEAAERGNITKLGYYLERTTDKEGLMNTRDPTTGATLLHLTISSISPIPTQKELDQRLELMKLLLANGADATACNLYGVQPIHMIPLHIPSDSLPYLEILLNQDGVNINARDGDGWTPLHYAARFCQPPDKVMQMLVERGAKVNATTGHKSCLFGLVANGDYVACFQWMVHKAKADVRLLGDSTNTREGRATLVLQAVKYGRLGILHYLIHHLVNQLKPVISLGELEQAHQASLVHGNDIEKEIIVLTDLLERDSRSLVAKQQRKQFRGPWWVKLRKWLLILV